VFEFIMALSFRLSIKKVFRPNISQSILDLGIVLEFFFLVLRLVLYVNKNKQVGHLIIIICNKLICFCHTTLL